MEKPMINHEPQKVCAKCQKEKPENEFSTQKKSSGKEYRRRTCKECRLAIRRERDYDNQHSKDKHKEWLSNNKDRTQKKSKEWKSKNRDRVNEDKRKWWHKNKDNIAARRRKIYQSQKEIMVERTNRWTRENPEKARKNKALHEARKRGAEGKYSVSDIRKLLKHQNGLCVYCGKNITDCYTVDHIHPLSRGGSNWPDNIQLLCSSCNCSKNNKTHEEYMKFLNT